MSGAVVITGASTGIGEATARRLAGKGFQVFAGVRKEADGERLRSDGITPVIVDVTDEQSISAAASTVQAELGDRGLAGLVNNAGVTVTGPVEFLPMDQLRHQFDVNTFGHVAVTQAFMPMLRKATGRIVFITSIGARVALPFIGPYAGSKSALASLAISMRQEVAPWGIQVALVEPGTVATEIWEKGGEDTKRALEALPPEGREYYGNDLERGSELTAKMGSRGLKPDRVARVVESALTSRRPRTRYLVGDAWLQYFFSRVVPDRLFDRMTARMLRS